jgi:hypothetical protein
MRPVSVTPLACFRIAFGVLMACEVARYFLFGWIRRDYVEPRFHFTYLGFSWVQPWPGWAMYVHFAVLGALAIMIALGAFCRVATILFFLGFTYVFLLDEAYYLNHFYLIVLLAFLLSLVPAHAAWSVDAWRSPPLRRSLVPAWTIWLLRFQMGVPYFFGGLAKLSGDWLHGEPMRIWLASRGGVPVLGAFVHEAWCPYLFSYGGLLIDLLAVPLLLCRRTTFLAFGVLATFHTLNAILFKIGVFPWLMLAGTVILFWPAAEIRTNAPEVLRPSPPLAGKGLVALFVAAQLLVPLRRLAYPGNVDWTEEGHRFAWHMKLRDKESVARFLVTNEDTRATSMIDPTQYLTAYQTQMLAGQPDMILQFAHYLAGIERAQGHRVTVRALVMSSLNGRPYRRLVDASVDLAKESRNLSAARWIVPLDEPLDHFGKRPL